MSGDVGVRRVRQSDGRYVFIIEGTTASYWVERQPCDLTSVDGHMDSRQYVAVLSLREHLHYVGYSDVLQRSKNPGDV